MVRRIRIMHVLPDLVPYGAERMAANLLCGLDSGLYESSIVSLFDEKPGSLVELLRAAGVRVIHLGKRRGLDLRMFGAIAKTLADVKPDILHTHNYVLRYTLPASARQRIPAMVHTVHNVADREVDRIGTLIHHWAFRGRVHPVAIAQKVAETFERVYRMKAPSLIPNGIEIEPFQRARVHGLKWREREGLRADELLYVCAARFFAQKNHNLLLEAFARGPAKLPNAKLLLAGDGGLQGELERQAESLGLRARVVFLGRRDDVPELFGAADVFVLASLWEGNPLSVMEAMAAGLPVVATEVGGVPELVHHGRHGFLVPPGDIDGFAAAMLRLGQNMLERRGLGEAAERRAREEFDARLMVEAYHELYQALLPARSKGKASSSHAA